MIFIYLSCILLWQSNCFFELLPNTDGNRPAIWPLQFPQTLGLYVSLSEILIKFIHWMPAKNPSLALTPERWVNGKSSAIFSQVSNLRGVTTLPSAIMDNDVIASFRAKSKAHHLAPKHWQTDARDVSSHPILYWYKLRYLGKWYSEQY